MKHGECERRKTYKERAQGNGEGGRNRVGVAIFDDKVVSLTLFLRRDVIICFGLTVLGLLSSILNDLEIIRYCITLTVNTGTRNCISVLLEMKW